MKDRYKERNIYARLCRYAYDSSKSDLCGIEYLSDIEITDIRFCYFNDPVDNCKYMAIRGTDNMSNVILDAAMLGAFKFFSSHPVVKASAGMAGKFVAGKVFELAATTALLHFEHKYGPCNCATGHSLGGKILEYLPERIKCVAFNAFSNEDRSNISSVRLHGDIAGPHTDHWIGNPISYDPKIAHKLDTMIDELEAKRDYTKSPVLGPTLQELNCSMM